MQSFVFRLAAEGVFKPIVCEAKSDGVWHVCPTCVSLASCYHRIIVVNIIICVIHPVQIYDHDDVGLAFSGLWFWWDGKTFALGEQTNGYTDLEGRSFVEPAEGPYALNSGENRDFVFTAFQVLLVRPVDGWCYVL
jgi:hypothetical protein